MFLSDLVAYWSHQLVNNADGVHSFLERSICHLLRRATSLKALFQKWSIPVQIEWTTDEHETTHRTGGLSACQDHIFQIKIAQDQYQLLSARTISHSTQQVLYGPRGNNERRFQSMDNRMENRVQSAQRPVTQPGRPPKGERGAAPYSEK